MSRGPVTARADGSDEGAAGLGLLTLGMVLVWGLEVDVPQVEDTALDVAAALRTTRRGAGVLSAMKRAFLRRGR